MLLIPTHCERCGRSQLVEAGALSQSRVACADCGGPVRAIPGASYGREDVTLFNELAVALADGGIGQPQAVALRAQLDALRSVSPGARFAALCRALPALPVLKTIARRELFTVRKAEGMLLTLLAAIATSKPQSGTLAAVDAPQLKTRGDE